jgi:23S rRNA pseudouridine1911/1915/1917 synthase
MAAWLFDDWLHQYTPWVGTLSVPDGRSYHDTMADSVHHITAEEAGQTIAALVRHWSPELTWTQARGVVERRRVMINGNLCLDPARRLKEAEVVKITAHAQKKPPDQEQVRLRHLDEHVVVVEKPAGVTTVRHPEEEDWNDRRKQIQPTLDELLPRVIAREERFSKHGPRQGLRGSLPPVRAVHRLDRDTSGLMVFARTVEAERHLGVQFKKHTVHRIYRAIVHGRLTQPLTLRSNLVRDRGDGRRGSSPVENMGKHAVTHVRPVEVLDHYTMVECKLETGRTHQIRIHLAENGHILCGEKVYNRAVFKEELPDSSGAPRIALHAMELGFVHPVTNVNLMFSMPLPEELAILWKRLSQKS